MALKEALKTNNNSAIIINGINLQINDTVEIDSQFCTINDWDTILSTEANSWVYFLNNAIRFSSSVFSVTVDGNPVVSEMWTPVCGVKYTFGITVINQTSANIYVGRRQSGSSFTYGIYSKIKAKGYEWINSGDFGSPDLPSVPAGLTATFDGAPEWVWVGQQVAYSSFIYKFLLGENFMSGYTNHREVDVSTDVVVKVGELITCGTGGTILLEDVKGVQATYAAQAGLPIIGTFTKIVASGTTADDVVLQRQ